MGTEAKRSFLSLNKRPLRQIVLPRLISFGLFFLAPHEGICGRGQTFHLIKDTFHISSPLSPVISLFTYLSNLSLSLSPPHLSLSPPLSFLFLIIHHRKPKGALRSYCTFLVSSWCLLKSLAYPHFDVAFKWILSKTLKSRPRCGQECRITAATVHLMFCWQSWVLHIFNVQYDWNGSNLNGFFRNQHYLFWKVKGRERVLCLTLFYFWGWLLEDYCKWQSIHYLDGSSGVGERVVS